MSRFWAHRQLVIFDGLFSIEINNANTDLSFTFEAQD